MVNFKTFEINLNSRIFKEWEESYDMIDRLWWPQFFMIFKIVQITLWSTCWTELRIDVLFPALPIYLQLNYEEIKLKIGNLNYFHLIFEIFCNLLVQPSHFPQCMYALVPLIWNGKRPPFGSPTCLHFVLRLHLCQGNHYPLAKDAPLCSNNIYTLKLKCCRRKYNSSYALFSCPDVPLFNIKLIYHRNTV